jgi:hypothetical protein
MLLNRTQIAQALGVSTSTVDRWRREGMPHATKGDGKREFNLSACEAWRDQHGLGSTLRVDSARRRAANWRQSNRPSRFEIEELGRLVEAAPWRDVYWLLLVGALRAATDDIRDACELPDAVWDQLFDAGVELRPEKGPELDH